MTDPEPVVYVVDDDASVRDALCWLLESVEMKVQAFASGGAFLGAFHDDRPGCLILDVRMPEMSGLELQSGLKARGIDLPVIVLTGHGDVKMAIRAMKAGAFDFFEKPFDDQNLIETVQRAVEQSVASFGSGARKKDLARHLSALTARERQILDMIVHGKTNKGIARELGIGIKTVEFHRANLMRKTKARSLAELVRMGLSLERLG